ncbi:helix-turn-helix domain-containing protein [Paenibacillus whitsoniae]|uniref:AraC family transcriptional regulator n=1 Tax=Paenibacillus whitsoniae TaxID=2496558 RepID=A0A430JI27_9BACL|nr:AraC family transcriptional regulator [Paenibacillus whitsoniae]RTE10717.1 AraC family transcriptional regulator [Paenibacillus whitsoniae]
MIELLSCGYNYIHPNGITIDRPAGAGNYAFVFFKSSAEIMVNGMWCPAPKHTYILFSPDIPHLYRELEKPFVNDWFHFLGEGVEAFLSHIHFPLNQLVQAVDPHLIGRSIMELQRIKLSGGPLCEAIVEADVRTLFMKLSNLQEKPAAAEKARRYYRQFEELRNELYSSPQRHRTVDSLAASLNLSKSYFQHIYKALFGCSVIQDMITGRLEYAKFLLDNGSLPIAAIADMCGYENDTHFMRQFKKYEGMTPRQYKSRP